MERADIVRRTKRGLTLESRVHLTKEVDQGFSLLGRDVNDLVTCVEENVLKRADVPNLHLKTEYDNIPARKAEEVRKWILKEGGEFHERVRRYLAKSDVDVTQRETRDDARVAVKVGAFSLISPVDDGED
jgi:hypothetical protein